MKKPLMERQLNKKTMKGQYEKTVNGKTIEQKKPMKRQYEKSLMGRELRR